MSALAKSLTGQAILLAELMQIVLEPTLEAHGLSISNFELLSAIQSQRGQATQAQIAASLRIRPPSLTEAVKSAVAVDLLRQVPDPSDKRIKRLELTPKAERILALALARLETAEAAVVEGLSAEDLTVTARTLSAAARNLARWEQSNAS